MSPTHQLFYLISAYFSITTESVCCLLHLAFISFLVTRNRIGIHVCLAAVKLKDQLNSHYHLILRFLEEVSPPSLIIRDHWPTLVCRPALYGM